MSLFPKGEKDRSTPNPGEVLIMLKQRQPFPIQRRGSALQGIPPEFTFRKMEGVHYCCGADILVNPNGIVHQEDGAAPPREVSKPALHKSALSSFQSKIQL